MPAAMLRGARHAVLLIGALLLTGARSAGVLHLGEPGLRTELRRSLHIAAGTTVRLSGHVVLRDGATLSIGPGAIVEAEAASALIITRESRVQWDGTLTEPIVMRCRGDAQPGCWQGVVLEGWAPINHGALDSPVARSGAAGGCRQQLAEVVPYGGCDAGDSSGVLRFVRVEDAADGLTLRGVGRGTVLEHVQVHRALGTGLTLVGGTARFRRVALTANGQTGLAWRGGWVGRAQWVAIQADPQSFASAILGENGACTDICV